MSPLALQLIVASLAADGGVMTEVCPLDGTRFQRAGDLVDGATSLRLDLRPVGRSSEPLVRCPRCQFVPGPEEPKPEELARLRTLVASPEYLEEARGRSDHALRARILTALQPASSEAAFEWLRASWELEDAAGAEWRRVVEQALSAFARVALAPVRPRPPSYREVPPQEKQRTAKLMQVELLRRLGRFTEATDALRLLRTKEEFQRGIYVQLLSLEGELVERKDSAPQPFPAAPPIDPRTDDPAFLAAFRLAGYAAVDAAFTVERADFGSFNLLPHALVLSLQARKDRPLDSAWWWNFTKDGKPQFDWNQFLSLHASAEELVAKNAWLAEWKAAGSERRVELELAGLQSNTAIDLDEFVLPAWRDAGFMKQPALQLILREGPIPCAEVFLDQGGGGIVPIVFDGCGSSHWLTAIPFSFHPKSMAPTYLRIDADAHWERRVMGKKR